MPVIDADTHIDETEDTWAYLDEKERSFAPVTVMRQGPEAADPKRRPGRYWLVDGQLRFRRVRDDERSGTTVGTRELLDVPERIRHMDQQGVDMQVIYPSFFLRAPSDRPDLELALCRSYNRWLADRCEKSRDRKSVV